MRVICPICNHDAGDIPGVQIGQQVECFCGHKWKYQTSTPLILSPTSSEPLHSSHTRKPPASHSPKISPVFVVVLVLLLGTIPLAIVGPRYIYKDKSIAYDKSAKELEKFADGLKSLRDKEHGVIHSTKDAAAFLEDFYLTFSKPYPYTQEAVTNAIAPIANQVNAMSCDMAISSRARELLGTFYVQLFSYKGNLKLKYVGLAYSKEYDKKEYDKTLQEIHELTQEIKTKAKDIAQLLRQE